MNKDTRSTLIFTAICVLVFLLLFFFDRRSTPTAAASSPPNTPVVPVITLGTDWFAQAEHGGFYQALAEGLYAKEGLTVKIQSGSPQVNGVHQLVSEQVDFFLLPSFVVLSAGQNHIPLLSVAAIFQRDLQILMAHPKGPGYQPKLADFKGRPIFIAPQTAASVWAFLVGKYGYTDAQKRPYSHSLAPFLRDPEAVQEGLLTSEPFVVQQQARFKPAVVALADEGFSSYGELVTCTQAYAQAHPAWVRAFIKATQLGWAHYLQDPRQGNALIQKENPRMSSALLQYAVQTLRDQQIVTGGDAQAHGIGAMTDARWQDFYALMVKYGNLSPNIDFHSLYTKKFLE